MGTSLGNVNNVLEQEGVLMGTLAQMHVQRAPVMPSTEPLSSNDQTKARRTRVSHLKVGKRGDGEGVLEIISVQINATVWVWEADKLGKLQRG